MSGLSGFGGVLAKTGVSAATSVTSTVAVNAIQYAGDWDGFVDSLNSIEDWQGCISSTVGSFVTNGLGAFNSYDSNGIALSKNVFNTDSIGKLNSLAGGLASTAVTFGLTGEATFNVLNIADFGANASSGLFEVTFGGKKGFSSRLGTGGADVSAGTLNKALEGLNNLNKNEQIKKVAKQSNMKNAATALRMQYGFGDETQLANLDSILKGQSVLKTGTGAGKAQTITENGKRTIYLNNYKENMTREEKLAMGITIGHEAYRDGITSDAQSQYIETVNAVLGHTVMAKKMQNDDMYNNIMAGIINNNQNLQNDLAVFDYAAMTGDWGAFGGYVGTNYDTSADYWKLVQREDGTYGVKFDFNHSLVDEEGNVLVKNDMDIFDEEGNIIGHKKEMSYTASLGMLLGTYTNYLDNSEKFTENRANDKAYIGKNTEKYMETQGFTWSTSDGWINTTNPDASIAVNGYTMTLVDLMSGKGVSLEEGFANFNLRDEKNNVIGKASVPYGAGLDRYLAFENMVPQGDLLKAGMFHVDTNGNVLMYGVSSTLPTPSDFGKDYPAVADGTYAFKYDNHYPVGGEPYSALRLFNGDYQNQNFDVSLVTGNNINNPDYRDNFSGFYFDNEGFLTEQTTNYINYHRSNNNEWLLNERRSGSQGCPITYPSQYWQVLPNAKTNRSVDGYFYINRTLYNYY